MQLDEQMLATIAYRLLQFYESDTGRNGTVDEATQWFAAKLFATLNTEEKGKFLEAFLRGKTADEQVEDLKWLLGEKRVANSAPN